MRIRVLSDLHIDVGGGPLPPDLPPDFTADCGEDVVVLAGDIAEGTHGLEWALRAFPAKPILVVLGNHEFYREDLHGFIDEFRDTAARLGGGRLRLLEKEAVVMDGVRFIGTTLWTDYALYASKPEDVAVAMNASRRIMMDYRRVLVREPGAEERFMTPEDSVLLHASARQYVSLALASGDPRATVVITHHAPHRGSLAPRFADDITSAGFVTDLSRLMGRAALWIHGHTHTSFDYTVNGTRVLCNPRGYCSPDGSRRENPKFSWDLIAEV